MSHVHSTPSGPGEAERPHLPLRVVEKERQWEKFRSNPKAFRSESAADMGAFKRGVFLVGAIVVVAGGVHIDQELMLPAIDRTMRVEDGVAERIAFLFAIIAGVLAWHLGKALREARAHGWDNPSFWFCAAGFLLIGATFFGMRLLAGHDRPAGVAEPDALGMAFLLLASYLAVGLLAASEAYYLVNPALSAKIRAQSKRDQLAPRVRAAEAQVTETAVALQTATYRQEAVHLEYEEAIRATHDVAAGARDYARLLIAASLGDPAQTGLVFDRYPADVAAEALKHNEVVDPTSESVIDTTASKEEK